MHAQAWLWLAFAGIISVMMVLDLGVFGRRTHAPSLKESLLWTGVWVGLALLFNLGIYVWRGQEKAILFFTGYVVEESLSVDNLFIMMLIFSQLRVPRAYQHKVLSWGIIGAAMLRALFIGVGVSLVHRFHWTLYIFGAFLVYTGIRLLFEKKDQEQEVNPDKNAVVRVFKKILPVHPAYDNGHFFVRQAGKTMATPLLIAVIMVESADVIFAMDSIPAILAISTDPFIVYTSNIFAILGLRSLFFTLSGFMQMFHYLNYGLSVILTFIGIKMLVADFWPISTVWALSVIACVLFLSVLGSVLWKPEEKN
jgi:tellurite resistance protein TerC